MQHHFLSKTKIPDKHPTGMQSLIDELKRCKDQEQCLKKVYETLVKKYRGDHFWTIKKPHHLWCLNVEKLWKMEQEVLHCTNMNYLARILLVKSGFFKNEDIKNKWTMVWYISPHQYLGVKLKNGRSVNMDVWGGTQGLKLGDYAHGTH